MRLFIGALILMLFSCKKEVYQQTDTETITEQKQVEITKCFKSSYQGDFNGSTIQLSIDVIEQLDDDNYKILGSTIHKENRVGYEGTLQLDNTNTSQKAVIKKFRYNLEEKAAAHGSGKFSGNLTLKVPVVKNNFNYNSVSVKFVGNYIFPDGNSFPCNFGLED